MSEEVCEICDFTLAVHSEQELDICSKIKLLNNLLYEIEEGDVRFTICTGTDKDKKVYLTSIERKDTGISFFGEGATSLEAIEDVLK